ncbi:PorP/SprF family type IX secretion system membrane protein [Sphingobacterium spiritivorum]|uniref:Bacteroidetes-specific putative membrane protein n=1 Tax=Sphingobacterium spiritivorum ATCC 33861 TaxID=525373 RepID=D7VPY6_SPHSI|nr:type IX secretion system membrane protein PorP/SprF [Sphingobacterium spiritivorum]EFK55837.1 Bacteroidetes-specific putative membrane protein [Sphingobacterium spiritivorum ATCC 33861]QQT36022.1 type IX secretion system membrane protein PorP/SprF [Sphingobacterium spiritivorum]WQD32752.1 type IX secretion system membrane protein PorP/SprF [Sphingobacterium spiritivorum]SUJ14379.1 Bacteroidetes-specific putative membrane protein [Sphingobacterium spiritivorum]
MKYGKYAVITIISLLGLTQVRAQQSIQFTQYIFNSMSVNPAYAGYKEEWFAQVGLRSQWTGWEGAPKTGTVSIDGVLDAQSKRHGVGLNVTADKLGAQSATAIYANYAFRLQLDDEDTQRLSLGIAGGVTQYSLDGNKLDPNDYNDQVIPRGKISDWAPDIRLGVYYYNPRWYAGVSVQDLFNGTNSGSDYRFNSTTSENLYRTVSGYFIAGALFELDRGVHLRPSILVKEDFKGPTSLDVNAMFVFNSKFWIGAGYRTRAKIFNRTYQDKSIDKLSATNAITGIAQFYATEKLRIGYSYDMMINRMSGLQNGSHEITLGLTFGRKAASQYLSPRFF